MTSPPVRRALLTARTVRYLRPAQVAHRARLRSQRLVLERAPQPVVDRLFPAARRPGQWPEGYVPVDGRIIEGFPSAEANADGTFRFLEQTRRLASDWRQDDAPLLWRFHLHYFEWAWSFTGHPEPAWARGAFAALWRSWRRSVILGRGPAWSPYVVSLRAWALCGVHGPLVAGTDAEADVVAQLGRHASFLRAHLELDVGGNHLLKNLKALVGLAVFFGDDRLLRLGTARLEDQVGTQVLGDGGHFERSPSYHCQVLADLLDVQGLLAASGQLPVAGMEEAVTAMRRWLGAMLHPDGDVPLFNDCTLVGTHRLRLLEPAAAPTSPLTVLEPSGYVVVRPSPGVHLVADVGLPCPSGLPAHAHADCLSFELSVGGRRVVVDSGTSTYEAGERRRHERATRAHNTVEVDGADQTEVWGTFRAGRRARPTLESAETSGGGVEVTASHDGYQRLPGRPCHRRTWRVDDRGVELVDRVTGTGRHHLASRLYLRWSDEVDADGASVRAGPVTVTVAVPPGAGVHRERCQVATGFGRLEDAHVVVVSWDADLPAVLRTRLDLSTAGPATRPASE